MNVDAASSSPDVAVLDAGPAPEALWVQEVTPVDVGSATEPIALDGSKLDGGSPPAELLATVAAESETNSAESDFAGPVLDAGAAPF